MATKLSPREFTELRNALCAAALAIVEYADSECGDPEKARGLSVLSGSIFGCCLSDGFHIICAHSSLMYALSLFPDRSPQHAAIEEAIMLIRPHTKIQDLMPFDADDAAPKAVEVVS